jgi:hypothetical protein
MTDPEAPLPAEWTVTVGIPADSSPALRDSLFNTMAKAAHDWEPVFRDGWDISVSGHPSPWDRIDRALAALADLEVSGWGPDHCFHPSGVSALRAALRGDES